MVFSVGGQLPESPSLTINNKAIEQVSSAKFLRVYIDQTLNWECHNDNACKRLLLPSVQLNVCGISSHLMFWSRLYNSLVQPHFDYCNVVWGNCNKGLSEKLHRLQNRPARIRGTQREHSSKLLKHSIVDRILVFKR